MSWEVLNPDALRKAPLVQAPYPYIIVDNLIRPEVLAEVVGSFPHVPKRGSFPPEAVSYSGRFARLIDEMHGTELRDLVGERLGMDLKDRPPMLTIRGRTGPKDGQIHTDSKSKLVTVLLYLNRGWSAPQGRLRLLYNDHDLTRYAAEIAPDAGRCLIFKVTPNCWHGHEPYDGERRTIQLNYVTSEAVREREHKRHRFSAFLKGLFSSKDAKSPAH
jgi:hypothetical protein